MSNHTPQGFLDSNPNEFHVGLPTFQAIQPQPASVHLTRLEPHRRGRVGAYSAVDESTGQTVEVRLLPGVDARELTTQQRLIQLTIQTDARVVVSLDDKANPPRLVLQDNGHGLSELQSDLTFHERLMVTSRFIEIVEQALLGGLVHGALSLDSVHVEDRTHVCIDYMARFYENNVVEEPPSAEKDAHDAARLVASLLNSFPDDCIHVVSGQQRAKLRYLLRQPIEAGTEFDLFDRWSALLKDIQTQLVANETSTPVVSEPADHDCTLEQRVILPTELNDEADDRTCEVQVVRPIDEASGDDHTSELNLSGGMTTSVLQAMPQPGDRLGRFRIESILGDGGMGVVYRAHNLTNGEDVALKVLRPNGGDVAQAIRRFRKEARLLSNIRNQYVTQLYDTGQDRGLHYIAMEFVDGTNLKDWIEGRQPLEEAQALTLIADVARGLVDAHEEEIIHRDLKPENILLGRMPNDTRPADALEANEFRIKLTDFGIARGLRQSVSMEVTRAGSLLGTPAFMSPEQCRGNQDLTPATDIYSLGITLYRLLSSSMPFESSDPMKLAAMHCFDPPPDLLKRNPQISIATSRLLGRMLAKEPADRPADAAQLVREIEQLLRGDTSTFEAHPRIPQAKEGKLWEQSWEWDLESKPDELWPHVSNTDRLNRAAGLHAVEYRTEKNPDGGLRQFCSFRLAGMTIEWEEHPFEWIEGQRMAVLREFATGPFQWFVSVVELTPNAQGGTRLRHQVRIQPRNAFGYLVASIEAGWKGGRAIDRIYRRIDRSLQRESSSTLLDPFEAPPNIPRNAQRRIRERVERMLEHGIAVDVAGQLETFLHNATPQAAARIRPLELADQLDLPTEEVLNACLVAAHCGLLKLRWDILCPACRAPATSTSLLSEIGNHTNCEACDADFQSDIESAIELVFQAHPEVREVDNGQYCIGGPGHSPHVVSQLRLPPGERIEANIPVSVGDYLVRGTRIGNAQLIQVRPHSAPSGMDMKLSQLGSSHHVQTVRTGQMTLALTNDHPNSEVIRVERTICRSSVVTATVASALPKFRELFPDQVFDRDTPVASDELTLMAVRVASAETLYETQSDADAYRLIQHCLETAERCIAAGQGAVIKSVGETLLASFHDSSHAVAAAHATSQSIQAPNDHHPLTVACAIHRGPLLVTNQNGRLDYFGTTVRQVMSLGQQFDDGIVMTDTVFTDSVVAEATATLLTDAQIVTVDLPGTKQRLAQHSKINT